ncbi:oligosaccharide flippase family protein [Candidatus Pacearchaeota archaeon]|nr:oligosaccharide flippase family protein [Candidatus Pacearchaeota archaeon]
MKLTKKFESPLVKGSILLVLSFGLFNFIHFMFQFFMARMLSITEYGILASLFSIIYIGSIFTESIQNVIVKYSAGKEPDGQLKNILKRSLKKISYISLGLFCVYLVLALFISPIFGIDYSLLALAGTTIFFACFIPITRGVLQGKKRFGALSFNMLTEAGSKLLIGALLVLLGIGVFGAVLGTILGVVFALGVSLFQIRSTLTAKEEIAKPLGIYDYAKPSLVITAVVVIFYSMDVILAKIFFSPEIAGSYAIASILGKIIFWGTFPISKAMLPFSSAETIQKNKKRRVFATALLLLLFGSMGILIIFSIFPNQIISIFSGKTVPLASTILFYNGIAFSFIAIANLMLLYRLSTGAVKRYWMLPIFLVIEVVLLSIFSNSLIQFTQAFIGASLIFLLGSFWILKERIETKTNL